MPTLEIGCGQKKKMADSIGVDKVKDSCADVIHDLNQFPYPFENDQFDLVIAEHVIEHLQDIVAVMEEIHRITKKGAKISIEVPHFSGMSHFTDPTHLHSFGSKSFDYFDPSLSYSSFNYSKAKFKIHTARIQPFTDKFFDRIISKWVNSNPARFERRFAFWFPQSSVRFELEVIK